MLSFFTAQLGRDRVLAMRGNGFAASFGFFLLAVAIAPLAFGSDPDFLTMIAPGLFWLLAVLAALLGLDGLFRPAVESGDLEISALGALPLSLVALSKLLVWWAFTGIPLALCVFPAAILYGLSLPQAVGIFASLIIGTPGLVLIGGAMSAVASGMRQSAGLVVFLTLPFFAPALIFGPQAAISLSLGDWSHSTVLLLAVFSLQALAVCPFICAASLRQHLE